MKAVYILAASAAVVFAQNSTLAPCGQSCINDMIDIMQKPRYNCPNNPTCFCCMPDFGYGIRDCATAACVATPGAADAAISYAATYCASALPTQSVSVCASFTAASMTGSSSPSAMMNASASSTLTVLVTPSAGAGGIGGIIAPVHSGASGYSIGSTTLTAGGPEATVSATDYSVLSNGDVVATASGFSTTYASSLLVGAGAVVSTAGSGSVSGSGSGLETGSALTVVSTAAATTTTTSAAAAAGSSSSKASSGAGAMITAAPAFMGAAALALLAL